MPQIPSALLSTVAMVSAFAALVVSWLAFKELRTSTERSVEQDAHTSFLAAAGIGLGALSLVIILTSGPPEATLQRCEIITARADAIAGTHLSPRVGGHLDVSDPNCEWLRHKGPFRWFPAE